MGKKPCPHWNIPAATCLASGGNEEQAGLAVAPILASYLSIVIIDDLLDRDGRFKEFAGAGDQANFAQAIAAAGFSSLLHSPIDPARKLLALDYLNEMMVQTSFGQYLDSQNLVDDESTYWKIARAKSSPFFGTAFALGAVTAGAQPQIDCSFYELGKLYGEMVQIHDDVKDALAIPASADWRNGHTSLPILFAKLVNHPEKAVFLSLCQNIAEPGVVQNAQRLLFHSGAISYCIKQLLLRGEAARKLLASLSLPNPEPVRSLLDQLIEPAVHMLAVGG
jgi:geranylgeranyl pyrophosphate synthase